MQKIFLASLFTTALSTTVMSAPVSAATPATIEEVVVTAHPLSGEGLSQASTVLHGDELTRKLDNSIGATLSTEAGISSAQFGNAVGRPVIHGLAGPRVRIMEDRIDTLDLSVTSADHAVTIEPFIAERIEVLKGASTLLYGSGAIGGVIDVHTGRIPHRVAEYPVSGGLESRIADNGDATVTSAKLNGGAGQIAWHLDATIKDANEFDIPVPAESRYAAQTAQPSSPEDHQQSGTLAGSHHQSSSYALGTSYVTDWGLLGGAISHIDTDYGLPGGHDEQTNSETASLAMSQTRQDYELAIKDIGGVFSSLNVRLGINDYRHKEIEPDGVVGTRFRNKAWELRAELLYDLDNWNGGFGLQHSQREFSAVGEEAFIPPVDTRDSGVFWLTEKDFATFSVETGLRIGQVTHRPTQGSTEQFTTYAASIGLIIPIRSKWQLGIIVDQSTRAPVSEELFSNGPHLITQSFELGNQELDTERARNVAATLRFDNARLEASMTTYYTDFTDFIYQQANGDMVEQFTVLEYRANDTDFYGIDMQASAEVLRWDVGDLKLRGQFDFVRTNVHGVRDNDLPRIPAQRFGFGIALQHKNFNTSIDFMRVSKQGQTAPGELPTDAYNDLNLYASVQFEVASTTFTLFTRGKNLTDDEQRQHTSFIKDLAPAPGRTIEVGLRLTF